MVLLLLQACFFYPKVSPQQTASCDVSTRQLTLDVGVLDLSSTSGDIDDLMAVVVVIGGVSAVVSGSIVLVGNTVHWLEKEGRCEDGDIRLAVERFVSELQALGGVIIHPPVEHGRLVYDDLQERFDM